jgi:hypothetical protein
MVLALFAMGRSARPIGGEAGWQIYGPAGAAGPPGVDGPGCGWTASGWAGFRVAQLASIAGVIAALAGLAWAPPRASGAAGRQA